MEQTFKTTIRNEREKEPVALYERNGGTLALLMPGQERVLESWNPETIYSCWTVVRFLEGGEVQLTENPDWPRPKGKWLLTAINIEGRACERRIIGGREVVLPKGLARTFEIEVDDPLAVYARMEIKVVRERRPSSVQDYNEFIDVVKDVFYDRSEDELQELAIELEKLATDVEELEHE